MAYHPSIDPEKCEGCVDICPMDVFEIEDGKSVAVNADACEGCESCIETCEPGAITLEER